MKMKTENADRVKLAESAQECVVGDEKVRSLNTVNRGIGSDDVRHTVDTRDIISRIKIDLLSRLRPVADRSA